MTSVPQSPKRHSILLPKELCGLGVIIDDALETNDLSEFFNILCRDFVGFVKKSSHLKSLRTAWEKAAKKHVAVTKRAEKKLIAKIRETYKELANRIFNAKLSERPEIQRFLNFINDALFFRRAYGNPPFYVLGLGMINGLCTELLRQNRLDLVIDIADISYSSELPSKPILTDSVCSKEVKLFAELKQSFNLRNFDPHWLPWLLLQVAQDCWHLSIKNLSSIELNYSSERQSLKSTGQLTRANYFNDLRTAREGRSKPQLFTHDRFVKLIKSMIRQIYVQASENLTLQNHPSEQIQSIALRLDGDVLHLIVNRNNNPTASIYCIKEFRFDSQPFIFIQQLLKNPGKKVTLSKISCSQPVAKLLERCALRGTLANIFIPQHTNRTATLYAQQILFSEIPEQQKLAFHELLPNLKPHES